MLSDVARCIREAVCSKDDDSKLRYLVDLFNALALPKMVCGVDHAGMLHVTVINKDVMALGPPKGITYMADYIWSYDTTTGAYTSIKSRYRPGT